VNKLFIIKALAAIRSCCWQRGRFC